MLLQIEDPDAKVIQQVINYTIPNWKEMLNNNFQTASLGFETETSFDLTAEWRMIVQNMNGRLGFYMALIESNQNPIWAKYQVQILKSDFRPTDLKFSSRYPINRYTNGEDEDQGNIWGWSLLDIKNLENPDNEITTENKLSLRITLTTFGKGYQLYSGINNAYANAPTSALRAPATQVKTVVQNYSSIENFLQTLESNEEKESLELKKVRFPFVSSGWNIFMMQTADSPSVLWGLQIGSAQRLPIYASYKINVVFGPKKETMEFGWYDQIFKFDRNEDVVTNNLNTVAELKEKSKTYHGPIQIISYIKVYTYNAVFGENIA